MKISKLINILYSAIDEHGDIDFSYIIDDCYHDFNIAFQGGDYVYTYKEDDFCENGKLKKNIEK